jgi:hypothetical protein
MIKLDDEIRTRLGEAIDQGKTLTAAYVDLEGKPHISFYGSTHVHADDHLALWVRNPQNALMQVIGIHPHIAFIYGDISSRFYATFEGQARVIDEATERDRVYDEMHPIERTFDPEKKGVAVGVHLERVTILTSEGKRVMERD